MGGMFIYSDYLMNTLNNIVKCPNTKEFVPSYSRRLQKLNKSDPTHWLFDPPHPSKHSTNHLKNNSSLTTTITIIIIIMMPCRSCSTCVNYSSASHVTIVRIIRRIVGLRSSHSRLMKCNT